MRRKCSNETTESVHETCPVIILWLWTMATIESETVDPLAAKTIEEPVKTQFQPDHRKSFVSLVDFRYPLDNPIETADLALSKTNFVWLRQEVLRTTKQGPRSMRLTRPVALPRPVWLCHSLHQRRTSSIGFRDWAAEEHQVHHESISSTGTLRSVRSTRFLRVPRSTGSTVLQHRGRGGKEAVVSWVPDDFRVEGCLKEVSCRCLRQRSLGRTEHWCSLREIH